MAEKFKLTIVTPDREFFSEDVDMVEFNTTEGEIGIYKGHIPLTVIVKPGILTITQGETVKNAALHAGFVQILPEEVTILAEIIEWPGEIDEERAKAARERAESRLSGGGDVDVVRAEAALMRATARINAAQLR
ncbi:MAG: ATP synthase F1 subunit epsilon [Lachnospiraceae bacterium]|nr:ATP synthase F1 subunit epsilon [Lachnospiraceae bacterium]MEE1257604.1 ATP synthase F1 subunit epsilon [Lachnospiraceae bacterium]